MQIQRAIFQPRTRSYINVSIDTTNAAILQNNVDDATGTFRIVFSTRARNNFNTLNLTGRNSLQRFSKRVTEYARRFSIDQEANVAVSLQFYIAIYIYIYLRYFFQQVRCHTTLRS